MDAHIHPPRDDLPYSPTADSAIDIPSISTSHPKTRSEPETETETEPEPDRRDIATRLADLATRISDHNQGDKLQDPIVLQCLDTIERTLSPVSVSTSTPTSAPASTTQDDNEDPRASFALEIAKYRPQSTPTATAASTSRSFHRSGAPSPSTIVSKDALASVETQTQEQDRIQTQMQAQMQTLLDQLSTTNTALTTRRAESAHIYDLFTHRCRTLEDKMRVLQYEVQELKTDIHESSIERETLRGTVLGLQDWIMAWQREDRDCEALVEGVTAWMRGWRDVDEGVCMRERERELRRAR